MEAELVAHEGEKKPPYTDTKFSELLESLRRQADRLHWALQERLKAKTEAELQKAREHIEKHAAHVGNYAMFIHDNSMMKRSG
jgi:hypothetical protein